MKRLITFGCSHTRGEGVEIPEKQSWPAYLSSYMNLELVNLGVDGASNRYIQHSINTFEFKPDDTVVILWTYPDRYHIFSSKHHIRRGIAPTNSFKESVLWYKHFHTTYNAKFDNQTIVHQANSLLKEKNITTYNIPVDLNYSYYFDLIKKQYIEISFTHYLESYPKGIDDKHMGFHGNHMFAHELSRLINQSGKA